MLVKEPSAYLQLLMSNAQPRFLELALHSPDIPDRSYPVVRSYCFVDSPSRLMTLACPLLLVCR